MSVAVDRLGDHSSLDAWGHELRDRQTSLEVEELRAYALEVPAVDVGMALLALEARRERVRELADVRRELARQQEAVAASFLGEVRWPTMTVRQWNSLEKEANSK